MPFKKLGGKIYICLGRRSATQSKIHVHTHIHKLVRLHIQTNIEVDLDIRIDGNNSNMCAIS